jgi:DNA polymerase-3 subunit delta
MNQLNYLFFGNEPFIIKTKLSTLIKQHKIDEFNIVTYDCEETDIDVAINDCLTMPFLGEHKLVIVKNAFFLTTLQVKKAPEQNIKRLIDYLNNPMESTILALTAPYEKLDERLKITKTIRELTEVVNCSSLSYNDQASWVRSQLGKNGHHITSEALSLFMKRVEDDFEILVNEVKKLVFYAEGVSEIDTQMIEEVVPRKLEDNIYELSNYLLNHQIKDAITVLHDLTTQNEDPMRITSMLISKYQEILISKRLIKKGINQEGLAKHFHVSSGRAYYMMQNANKVNDHVVVTQLKQLHDLDVGIKLGSIDKFIGLELFIMKR